MIERAAAWIWARRWALLALFAPLVLIAAGQAAKVGVDNSLRIWFLDDDPHLVAYRSYQQRFGSDEVVVVAFHRQGGMASGAGLQLLGRAESLVAAVEGVEGVVSIAALTDAVGHLSEEELRRHLLGDAALRDRLISRDGTTAALIARLGGADDSRRDAVLRDIEGALAKLGEPHHLAGIGVLYVALNRLSLSDAATLFWSSAAVMLALLWLVFGRLGTALLAIGVAVCAMLCALGLYGALGRDMNMVTSAMPSVILVVGVAEMVHVLLCAAALPPLQPRDRFAAVLAQMLPPCALNIATSALGFAALALSPLPAVRDLGLFTAVGLLACLPLTVLGAALAVGSPRLEPRNAGLPALGKAAMWLCELAMRRPNLVLSVAAAVTLAAVACASRLVVDTFTLDFLASEHRVRRDSDFIEQRLAPYVPMDFLVRHGDAGTRPELLQAIERWQRAGERLPGVGWSRSPADGEAELEPRSGADGTLRVTFSVAMQSAGDAARTMKSLGELARLPAGASVEPAGYLPLYVRMIDYIVDSQVRGFSAAFVAVFALIAAAFRSVRFAALAMPSNLLPLVLILGAMGAAGIRLDAATVTIATVVLGLVVDDTVHFLHRLRESLGRCAERAAALRATVASAGHAILTTALVMSLGFAVFGLSEIKSLVYFGLLIAIAMASSAATDLLVVPALVVRFKGRSC